VARRHHRRPGRDRGKSRRGRGRRLTAGLPGAYLDDLWNRWVLLAKLARYGHQPLPALLGRQPTNFELEIFCRAIDFWLEAETPDMTMQES
jgi:hypothetical protein